MLAVPALRSAVKDEHRRGDHPMDAFVMCSGADDCGFPDFSDANALLDSIDFDDLFVGMDDGDVLPGLEMDPELLAEFSISAGEESSDVNSSPSPEKGGDENTDGGHNPSVTRREDEEKSSGSVTDSRSATDPDETSSGKNCNIGNNSSPKESRDKNRKSSSQSKNSHGKRKVKVDWTPELHRRFVQAVEQLGVDKAVPSRILELMGIDCLTRHNIASHLQKYRSHRKHLLAREAEAASWTQRRQMYGGAATGGKRPDMNPWLAPPATRPTMGFPPMAPSQPPPPMHHFRPLHVWGHPSMDPSVMHMWPKHLPHSTSPPQQPVAQPWGPPPDSPFWHHNRALTPGTPCFPQALPPATRFGAPHPVPGIPPHAMYKVDPGIGATGAGQAGPPPRPLFDFQPSKESIDAAIGDVLSKPWQPLPLGLKPPSTDSVMVELQRQGVPKIPPTTTTCA